MNIYIYIYMYVCVCVCVAFLALIFILKVINMPTKSRERQSSIKSTRFGVGDHNDLLCSCLKQSCFYSVGSLDSFNDDEL